ncbi:MAG: UDP-3-O-[3-hydroxymyristoyl] N-acetylglucosamine deacetylase [Candidatus Saganbacteria bacterium]|nr:UDP-3-O-[3-hydroxymyristoyl] N-acetylglucosamine deacetylase [Candidatus Saganbacteria bacterium]
MSRSGPQNPVNNKQKTIASPVPFCGIGLHSGKNVSLLISPASPNAGVYFIKQGKKVPALANCVSQTKRGTTLGGICVVEHLLSAVYALGLDNLQIEIDGDEVPALDGSALPFVLGLAAAGIVEQNTEKAPLFLSRPITLTQGEASLSALPHHGFKIDFMVDFPFVGEQSFGFCLEEESYKKEIAPARTVGYLEEYEDLKKEGLAQGASLENALVISKKGYVNQPRFRNEVVRHKILDLIGDLSLSGRPLRAHIFAIKSGHKLNIELVRRILNACQC